MMDKQFPNVFCCAGRFIVCSHPTKKIPFYGTGKLHHSLNCKLAGKGVDEMSKMLSELAGREKGNG